MIAAIERHVIAVTLALIVLVGLGDYLSGVEITFMVLTYLLPIVLGTWLRGRVLGTVLALLATACATAIFVETNRGASPGSVILNGAGSLGMFLVVIWILEKLRGHVLREQLQRHAAVEQLRHAERLNVIGVLAAGVAHELGTPLSVIAGTAELIESEALSHARNRELATMILSQTDKISAIIRQLLDFGRRGRTARTTVDLGHVAATTLDLLAPTARKRGAVIEVSAPEPVRVRANRPELEQVLSNLMLNGIQAMPRGGTLRIRTGVETRPDGEGVRRSFAAIAVEDEGTGIAASDLPKIFDPFFTTKGVGEGTGLGLSVSYGIVKDHGGTIEVRSTPGRGTEFVVLLPA